MSDSTIVVAGATGNLGGRVARVLVERGARVKALVRHASDPDKIDELEKLGAAVSAVDWSRVSDLSAACAGASCVVSALDSSLRLPAR